jgi:N6-L-threonylcarbamoyladenine synthase
MKILAIETSCDETAVAIIEGEGGTSSFSFRVLGNTLVSQIDVHKEYGGVFPMLAKREHAKNLVPLVAEALQTAGLLSPRTTELSSEMPERVTNILSREPETITQITAFLEKYERPAIDAIAVTHGPGLEPALWVGINVARALKEVWGIPLVPVNHMEGHIFMSLVKEEQENGEDNALTPTTYSLSPVTFPALALLISGGHTEMVLMREWFSYERIGATRDDAVGEAFDKVARLLGLPYPGGPEISHLAKEARERGIESPFVISRPMIGSGDLDFSFSGAKTAVRNWVEKMGVLNEEERMGIAREFEDMAADVFERKVTDAYDQHGIRSLIVGGGVAANQCIRERLARASHERDIAVYVCPPTDATDNALMIALAGYFRAQRGEFADPETLRAQGTLELA